jgi:predicted  nucleic acid-binding Zn-ribbon protein
MTSTAAAGPAIAEQLVTLAELANVDAKNRTITEKLESLPSPAKKADEAAAALKKQIDDATARREAADKANKAIQHEIVEERNKIKKWEGRANDIRGEREHAALLSEISTAKRVIHRHEDAQIEHMEVLEKEAEALKSLDLKHKAALDAAKTEWAKVDGDLKKLKEESAAHDVSRQALLKKLPVAVVKRYEMVASKRMGVGVSLIRGEMCMQCKRMLPPQLCIQVRKGVVLEQCPSCSRFLVHEDQTKAAAPAENAPEKAAEKAGGA